MLPACIATHMLVMQEAFHSLLTPEQQKAQLAKSRKMTKKMEALAAETKAATDPGATAGAADQPPSPDAGVPSLPSPLQGLNGADAPSAAAADFRGRHARVGAEYSKMFPTDGMFRRVRRHLHVLLSGTSCVSCCASRPPNCIW